ncbi:papain family cysteine protease, partial [Oesophagostomum dentatum]
ASKRCRKFAKKILPGFRANQIVTVSNTVKTFITLKAHISDTDILACCVREDKCGNGCGGGNVENAFNWVVKNGVCTGGRYKEKDVCKPYPFYPCGQHGNQTYYGPCPEYGFSAPKCRRKCQLRYSVPYENDLVYGEFTREKAY